MRPRWLLILIPCVLVAVGVMMLGPWARVAEAFEPRVPFEMEPAPSEADAAERLSALPAPALGDYRSAQIWDVPFAIANALAVGVLLLVGARVIWKRTKIIWILAAIPALILLGEGLENVGILSMLDAFENAEAPDPTIASAGTSLKFAAFAVGTLGVVLVWAGALLARLVRSKRGGPAPRQSEPEPAK